LKILETKKNVQEKNKQKHNFIFLKLNQINKIKELQKYKLKLKILFYFIIYQILFVATSSSWRTRRKNCPPFDHLAKCQKYIKTIHYYSLIFFFLFKKSKLIEKIYFKFLYFYIYFVKSYFNFYCMNEKVVDHPNWDGTHMSHIKRRPP
jgi:hypothetical protein